MESFSCSSYPDSSNSSPRSREIDDALSWDDQLPPPPPSSAIYKVKLMCSYGGKILTRSHDNQLAYTGGETKILAVDRYIKYSSFIAKLVALCGGDTDICFKYQLPGEDLDALISVTNDEDLDHMMLEYDRLHRAPGKQPPRLRIFLFRLSNPPNFATNEVKSERQWFVDALNSVQPNREVSPTPTPPPVMPDFLFGFDKQPPVREVVATDVSRGLEDRQVISDFQRFQVGGLSHEETVGNKKPDNMYIAQKVPEIMGKAAAGSRDGGSVTIPQQMPIPAGYVTQRQVTSGAYQEQQQLYMIPTPTLRQVAGQGGQGYYRVQGAGQEVYNAVAPGYMQVGYDNVGRTVYITAPYPAVPVAVDGWQSGGVVNQDGKVVAVVGNNTKSPQTSSV